MGSPIHIFKLETLSAEDETSNSRFVVLSRVQKVKQHLNLPPPPSLPPQGIFLGSFFPPILYGDNVIEATHRPPASAR